jgi:membrane carboxypeptidase/penicillin-binding protein
LVWVGFDNGDTIQSTGSSAALPIWVDLMQSIPHHISGNGFRMPTGIVKRRVCADENPPGMSIGCRNAYEEYFLQDNVPQTSIPGKTGTDIFKKVIKGITDIFK